LPFESRQESSASGAVPTTPHGVSGRTNTSASAAAPASTSAGFATGRTATAAIAAAMRFSTAVATSVRSKPSAGITTKPAASEPTIAPSVFQA
jgi:hypothetical protein